MRLRLSSVLRFMQEAAGRHLEGGGFTYEKMREEGTVFLLTRIGLRILRLPAWRETAAVETWFAGTEGAHFVRNMRFSDERGRTLIEAQTLWVTVNPETHRILRPNAGQFGMTPVVDRPSAIRAERISAPKGAPVAGRREIRYTDLDYNHHLNNAVYADLLCDYFPGGFFGREIEELQINFLGEALLGETVVITAGEDAGGRVAFSGSTEAHRCFTACVKLQSKSGDLPGKA